MKLHHKKPASIIISALLLIIINHYLLDIIHLLIIKSVNSGFLEISIFQILIGVILQLNLINILIVCH